MIICILKESKINELRTPLVPKDILLLKKSFPNLSKEDGLVRTRK